MIRLGKQVLCLILFLNVLCIGSNVIAHPHVFIVQRLNIVFDNKGLTGFWVEWNFDEIFSSMIAPIIPPFSLPKTGPHLLRMEIDL